MKNFVFKFFPVFFQNLAISLYNTAQYRVRHGGKYRYYRDYFKKCESMDRDSLLLERDRRLKEFLNWARLNSGYYSKVSGDKLLDFPVLEKKDILDQLWNIATISEKKAVVSLTGGTTGASMKVLYKKEDVQERHALLDHFRSLYGYSLGSKVAWFSGKDLVRFKDLKKGICYRDDWINKIRFFSTFHINRNNFDIYWSAFVDFSPEFIVGFPSSVYELCLVAKEQGLSFKGKVKAFFPTAETVLPQYREVIQDVLGCPLIDQYASSEGAPFILQCSKGRLHIHPLTGVFEVVDSDLKPAQEGEVLVTSFSTRGTPLVRYRIGDRLCLSSSDDVCECGSLFPLVDFIDGRESDFVFSPYNGRVNLGNLSNCTKDAPGIVCFQIIQDHIDRITVRIVKGHSYDLSDEKVFIEALRRRVGQDMGINVEYVVDIPREKSGKFRIVKNSLKIN